MNKMITRAAAALIAAASFVAPASAGSYTPGSYHGEYVGANDSNYYHETFRAGELAAIELEGDCTSDIDLWVYDEYGNLIAKSTRWGCNEYVSFVPAWTGEFEIRVENSGKPNGSGFVLTTY